MNSVQNILDAALEAHKSGHFLEAEGKYLQVLRFHPNHSDAKHLLGVTFLQREDYETAISHLECAVKLMPQSATIRSNLGVAYRSVGKPQHALKHLTIAIETAPNNPGILYNLANTLSDLEDTPQAAKHYESSLKFDDRNPDVWNNYGLALNKIDRIPESIVAHRQAIRHKEPFPEAYFNLGNALRAGEKYRKAIEAYRTALKQRPDYADAWVNLGHTQEDLGLFDEAATSYQTAIEVDHNHTEANFNLSLLWLRCGNLKKGWDRYEWRLKKESHSRQWEKHRVLNREDLREANILVIAEQGIGDEVMFASCIHELKRWNPKITLECDKRLIPIFTRSFPEIAIVPRGTSQYKTSSYLMIALASLPRLFRNHIDRFPQSDSFLHADNDKSQKWQSVLRELGTGLKVGISWRGGRERHVRNARSLPLEAWKPLLQQPEICWVNLQHGNCDDEIRKTEQEIGCRIRRFPEIDPLKELDDYFAIVSKLDLVISVDNATVHFAGSVGTPVWTMLPFNSDWRWFLNRNDTPWYPSMKLYRQKTLGDWTSVLKTVSNDLTELTQEHS